MICNNSLDDLEMDAKSNRKLRDHNGALGNLNILGIISETVKM
jgi:hypothetical protein